MKKSRRFLIVLLVVAMVLGGSAFAVSAATGDNVVTYVKEVVEKHNYYVNDMPVTEKVFNEIAQGNVVTTEEVIIDHNVYTKTVYKINGKEVSKGEYQAAFVDGNVLTLTLTPEMVENRDIDAFLPYFSFTMTVDGQLLMIDSVSTKPISVTYKYNKDTYLKDAVLAGDQYYIDPTFSNSKIIYESPYAGEDKFFLYGKPDSDSLIWICDSSCEENAIINHGGLLVRLLESDPAISFGDIFESITIHIEQ